jgi:hypothetical protein
MMQRILGLLALCASLNAAVVVHVGDDTEAWFGEDVVSEDASIPATETLSVRFGLSAANLVAQSIVEDYLWVNGVEDSIWADLVLNFETPVYTLTCYRISDFWSDPSPRLANASVIDSHFYPLEVWSTDYSVGPVYLDIDGQTEVWLDWNSDTTLRVTWGPTAPTDFNRYLHDGTQNPNWVAPLTVSAPGKGKKLGHYK